MVTEKHKKLFVVRKYIYAKSAKDAIKLEKTKDVDDVWIDTDWQKNNLSCAIGFNLEDGE